MEAGTLPKKDKTLTFLVKKVVICIQFVTNYDNKLGLSCAKLTASLNLFGLDQILVYFDRLTCFEFANLSYELNVGALLLMLQMGWFCMFCTVQYTLFDRFGLVDLSWFAQIEVVFIFEKNCRVQVSECWQISRSLNTLWGFGLIVREPGECSVSDLIRAGNCCGTQARGAQQVWGPAVGF